jgi:hypothetical protein
MPSITRKAAALYTLNHHRFKFRTQAHLAEVTGINGDALVALLTDCGARRERHNPLLWGLISRVGGGPQEQVQAAALAAIDAVEQPAGDMEVYADESGDNDDYLGDLLDD